MFSSGRFSIQAKRVLGIWVLLAFALAGCAQQGREVVVDPSMNGERVTLAAGQTLIIMLPATPGTGYAWEVEGELDEAVLRMEGEPEFRQVDLQNRQLVGQEQAEVLRFEAVGAGEQELALYYHRSWEEGVDPLEIFRLTVEVE